MSSLQGDEFEPSLGPGGIPEAAPSLTMSTNDEEYGSHRNEDGDPDANPAESSEQEPVNCTGGIHRTRAGGSEDTGVVYSANDRDSGSFAVNLTSMIAGIIDQTQATLEGFLTNVSEIDSSSSEVMEELQNAKDRSADRKCKLEEDRDKVHQAVCRVLEVLNMTNTLMDMARPQLGPDSDDGDH